MQGMLAALIRPEAGSTTPVMDRATASLSGTREAISARTAAKASMS